MIEYIIAHSPDDRVIENACKILKRGGIVCLPTDTNWILIADPTHKDGLEKLYKIKKENGNKHFSLFVPDISTASEVAFISDQAFKLLKKVTPGHYTFIFEAKKRIAKSIKATKTDKEVGLRFVPSILVETLLKAYGDVVISTNIPPQAIAGVNEGDEIYSYMIEDSSIKNLIDIIIDPGEIEFAGQSSIISFLGEIPEVVREGAGDISIF
jgi:tRNA threonylcarbamoyl adenosine modification protein (Sua5/YciO/YrdC/YwlC family)